MKTYWLSMHVAYACRHSGACCSSGWPIPIERTRTTAVGLLRGDGSWLQPSPGAPPDIAGTLAIDDRGRCVFYDRGCEIQRVNGHAALPSACQHFPREVLIDGRGVSVSLSHYCPTAAEMLFDHVGPVEVVEGPPALPSGDPEGLDAREVLPPLLAAGVLMDLEGYSPGSASWFAFSQRTTVGRQKTRSPRSSAIWRWCNAGVPAGRHWPAQSRSCPPQRAYAATLLQQLARA